MPKDNPRRPSTHTSGEIRLIAPGFFKTMGTRVIAGRDFTWTDLYEKRHVAIVSENLAREWWGDPRAALGQAGSRNARSPPGAKSWASSKTCTTTACT